MTLNIVLNLDVQNVSWASAFVNNSRLLNVSISKNISKKGANLFIGDIIPWSKVKYGFNAYYLAATSFNNILSPNKLLQEIELENIYNSDLTILSSYSELKILKNVCQDIDFTRVIVAGFPLNIKSYLAFRKVNKRFSACFVSNLSEVKSPDLQYQVTEYMQQKGCPVSCFYTAQDLPSVYIKRMNCFTYHKLPHDRFIQELAAHKFCISVSAYESLSVSTMEAALVGCIPICPTHSGFRDWCPPSNTYMVNDCESIWSKLETAKQMREADFFNYDTASFYEKVFKFISL